VRKQAAGRLVLGG